MQNALSIDVEDWFQVENLRSAIDRDKWDHLEHRVDENTRRILRILREHDATATFFVLGWVAERYPDLVREIDREGHEVASHGYSHQLVYEITREEFREDIRRSKQLLENIIGKRVIGYRAPSFSIREDTLWALDELRDAGFEYDSSVFPVSFHDRYGFSGYGDEPFVWPNGLREIPLAVLRLGKLALPVAGGGYFRLLPYCYFRNALRKLNKRDKRFVFYMHPWEMDPGQPRIEVPQPYRMRHYINLDKTEERLRKLLKDFQFTSISAAFVCDPAGNRKVRRTKVVFLIDELDSELAGTENQLMKLVRGLSRDKFDVHLICLRNHRWFSENRATFPCPTHVVEASKFKRPQTYANLFRLVSLLRQLSPDVVHTFFPVSNIVGVAAARIARVPAIVSSRRDYGEWMVAHYLWVTRLVNHFVTRIVTNSSQVKQLTVEKEDVKAGQIEVIPNAIDTTRFRDLAVCWELKQSLGIPTSHKVVGIVANYRPMKRHETFIRIAREVLNVRDDVDFILIGQNAAGIPIRESLEQMGRNLGIHDRLHFVGAQRDVKPFLSILDVGVNCSEGEGLSNAIMEYMAAGVPCVIANSGGNPDLVTSGVNGILFDLDDYHAATTHILSLLSDRVLRDRLVAAARERLEREMSLSAVIARYEKFYSDIGSRDYVIN